MNTKPRLVSYQLKQLSATQIRIQNWKLILRYLDPIKSFMKIQKKTVEESNWTDKGKEKKRYLDRWAILRYKK